MKLSELILKLTGELHRHGDGEVEYLDSEWRANPVEGVRYDSMAGCVQLTYDEEN